MKSSEVVAVIEAFLKGKGGPWDWGNFLSTEIEDDPALDKIRQMCRDLPDTFPPGDAVAYCNPDGLAFLEKLVVELKKRQ